MNLACIKHRKQDISCKICTDVFCAEIERKHKDAKDIEDFLQRKADEAKAAIERMRRGD